jgi:hypothetical protein
MEVAVDNSIETIKKVITDEFPDCPLTVEPGENQYRKYIEFRIKLSARHANPDPLELKSLAQKFDGLYEKIHQAIKDLNFEYRLNVE